MGGWGVALGTQATQKYVKKYRKQPKQTISKDRVEVFYPRDAMLARVFAIATCLSVRPTVRLSVCLSHAGIVPSRAKTGS